MSHTKRLIFLGFRSMGTLAGCASGKSAERGTEGQGAGAASRTQPEPIHPERSGDERVQERHRLAEGGRADRGTQLLGRRGGLILAILVLPFMIPTLIFGVSAANAALGGTIPFATPFLILTALSLIAAVVGTVGAAAAPTS